VGGKGRLLVIQYSEAPASPLIRVYTGVDRAVALVLHQILEYPLNAPGLLSYMYHKAMELRLLLKDDLPHEQAVAVPRLIINKLQQLDELLHNDSSCNYSIASLAQKAGMNQSLLKKYFKRWSGNSIHQYIIGLKMQQALDCLQNSRRTVKEIAYELGFKNDANFSQAFKKYFAYRPGEIRKEYMHEEKRNRLELANKQRSSVNMI
jgi:AraC-like DNA-binding protein